LPNIALMLKEEMARVARRTLRAETEGLKKASAQYRSEIAALKRRVDMLERQLGKVGKKLSKGENADPVDAMASQVRFSAKGLRALRKRLGVSAGELAVLVGVSAQTIYNWETGNTRPRRDQVAAIAALRHIGKREVKVRLSAAA
jgi:DNA-binding transcriptional regulator YiaG